jgi:hypothetical protein
MEVTNKGINDTLLFQIWSNKAYKGKKDGSPKIIMISHTLDLEPRFYDIFSRLIYMFFLSHTVD